MAILVPETISSKSAGEKRLFKILSRLPDDCIVYYEPYLDNRRPDFIVIMPDVGILVIEVKGWYSTSIEGANSAEIIINNNGKELREQHPLAQGVRYQWKLADLCKKGQFHHFLLQKEGKYKNKFLFPFSACVVLSNIDEKHLIRHPIGNLTEVFAEKNTITKDLLLSLEKSEGVDIKSFLKQYFDPWFSFTPLNLCQIKVIRRIIHPEFSIIDPKEITSLSQYANELQILDYHQEQRAALIGDGLQILFGVVGSGKTVLLIAHAKRIHESNPESKILVLCYNVAFGKFLKSCFFRYPRIHCVTFHKWAFEHNVIKKKVPTDEGFRYENDDELGRRFKKLLEEYPISEYDAVCIDEGQDFEPVWFQCADLVMKDRKKGDMLIVTDGKQGIYSRKKVSWSKIFPNREIRGHVHSKRFSLDLNYRNTYEIVKLAYNLVDNTYISTDNPLGAIPIDPQKTVRTGPKPILVETNSLSDELECLNSLITQIISQKSVDVNKIGIFYPRLSEKEKTKVKKYVVNSSFPIKWVTETQQTKNEILNKGAKLMTLHSSKGLQYQYVFMVFLEKLEDGIVDEKLNKTLCYIGMTRAETFLTLIYSGYSSIVHSLKDSSDIDIVNKETATERLCLNDSKKIQMDC